MKPGQLAKINNHVVRCMKREEGCKGCIFEDPILCPSVAKNNKDAPDCVTLGIIFVRP
jgi:hypothetical protein